MSFEELENLWGKAFVDECRALSLELFGAVNLNSVLIVAIHLILTRCEKK